MDITVFVECSKDSKNVLKKTDEGFKIIKTLREPFPASYGFIPKTHNVDGFPLDVMVLTKEPVGEGTLITARPIGVIRLRGKIPDDILIAVPIHDDKFKKIKELKDIPEMMLDDIKNFLEMFKENKIERIFGAEHAERSVKRSFELYERESG